MDNCTLCAPTTGVVAANDHWILMVNENQATLGRVFFALKRHETDVTAFTPEEERSLWSAVRAGKDALTALFAPDHFNYMMLMNLTPHAHLHIFPRYQAPRIFQEETFIDSHFGDHYDPNESRALSIDLQNALIKVLADALPATAWRRP